MNFNRSLKSEKSVRVVKLKRRVKDLHLEENSDFLLEKEGNITNYLKSPDNLQFNINSYSSKNLPFNIIGPSKFLLKTPVSSSLLTPNRKSVRTSSNKLLQPQYRQGLQATKVDAKQRFNELMNKINQARIKGLEEEGKNNDEHNFTDSEYATVRLKYPTQLKINKKSSSQVIEMPKLVKDKLKENRFDYGNNLIWYMTLRENKDSKQLESYMRIGNDLNGLYTKFRKPNPLFKPKDLNNDLEVIGLNKLELEIQAVENVGYQYLCPELLDHRSRGVNETIEENYDIHSKRLNNI